MSGADQGGANWAQRFEHPPPALFWRVVGVVGFAAVVLDLLVALPFPPTLFLAVALPASALVRSPQLTARLTAFAVGLSLLMGIYDFWRSGGAADVVGLRLGGALLLLLLGSACSLWLTRPPAVHPYPLRWDSGLPDLGLPPLERAAHLIARLTDAREMSVQRTEGSEDGAPDRVWRSAGGQVLVRFTQPGYGEVLAQLTRPRLPLAFIRDAAQVLQMQLDRAALLAEVQSRGEVLRDLVYAFSHDLRTPITAQMLSAQAALSGAYGPLPSEYAAALERGLESSRGLLALSDQLMLVAEYESGGPVGDERSVFDLEPLVRSVVADVAVRTRAHALTLEVALEPLSVRGYRYDLRRAVQNLLDNAVRFAPEGSVVALRVCRERQQAVIEVADWGPGVPAGQEAQLFQRFRLSTPRSGSGIGLYLTRRIVERHGGTVAYLRRGSSPAATVFRICLPEA